MRIAMEKNHTRPASQMAVAVAEAQHRQALAAYWPQVSASAGIQQLSSSPNFIYPSSNFMIPAESISVPGGSALVTIPANAFGPGFPPVAVQLPVSFPGETITTSAQAFPVPSQNVKLFDPTTESVSGNLNWLLMDFGLRRGLREQSTAGVEVAQAGARRSDLELADSVIRLYYGAVLARQLHQLGEDTLERMQATLQLTEALYKDGTGTVKKPTTSTTRLWSKPSARWWRRWNRTRAKPKRVWPTPSAIHGDRPWFPPTPRSPSASRQAISIRWCRPPMSSIPTGRNWRRG
jgi:hypothetical protein